MAVIISVIPAILPYLPVSYIHSLIALVSILAKEPCSVASFTTEQSVAAPIVADYPNISNR